MFDEYSRPKHQKQQQQNNEVTLYLLDGLFNRIYKTETICNIPINIHQLIGSRLSNKWLMQERH
jgi:hypothetical protein